MTTRVVNTIPSEDRAFHHAVERVAAERSVRSAEELVERLQALYPRVAVFERQLSGEPRMFYVYRDGRFRLDPADQWWAGEDVARATISVRTGRLVALSGEFAKIMDCDPEDLIGRHFTDFVVPDARAVAKGLFEVVLRGEVRSRARVQRPDASTLLIEFRAVRQGNAIEVAYRPVRD